MACTVTILGNNSALPANNRHPSAQVFAINRQQLFLIDCGEGTQMQLQRYKIKPSKIHAIFISHLHGDHYYGLLPLLDSFYLMGRKKPLHLYGPPQLQEVMALQHKITGYSDYGFPLYFHPIDAQNSTVIFENKAITVRTLVLKHGIACTGFLFQTKQKDRGMIAEMIERYNIDYLKIPAIKKGADFITADGQVIKNEVLTNPAPNLVSYAYCSDTAYNEAVLPYLNGVDVLYHEATYLNDMAELAAERGHATALQAATIAKKAKAKCLLLGHFSSRYANLNPFLLEAKQVFANTAIATEGETYKI